jgi:D-alanyl-D-alanine carboxypeptidase/Putative peptidoglycan binding domain
MSKVAWDYIVPIKMPADLKGVEPGKLPESLLRAIPTGGKLHWLAANAWNAMVAKAKADGIELKPTSSGDLYRSYESQLASFKQRYVLEPVQGTSTKTFEGKTWYLKKGMAMLATPGKSNHNLGIAVDVHSASEPKRLNWLIANVKDFGFSWEVVPSEPWHLRYVCGDTPPPAVVAYAAGQPAPAASTAAAPVADVSKDANKELQQALKDKGFYNGAIDGDLGPKTQEAVKAFKVANKLNADSIVGPKVKELLGLK